MSLLAAVATAGGGGEAGGGPPYEVPTSAPFNAPVYMALPTPDGSGKVVHPSVIDFGQHRRWRGFRYWMAMSPYPDSDISQENPCMLVSNDGWDWQVPAGLTNPVYGEPPYGRFNSDPDLEYDPRSDELVLIYREQQQDASQDTLYARSRDGVTWPHKATRLNWTRPGGDGNAQVLSPCLIRRGEGDWVLFGILRDVYSLLRYEATSPEGPWSGPFVCSGFTSQAWHLDILWDGTKFLALVDRLAGASDGYMVGTSTNGQVWTFSPGKVMEPVPGAWDNELYRPTFTIHENGTHARVWYSALGADSWRTSYTELPLSLWPAP